MTERRRVVYVIGFSAPPVLQLDEFLGLLIADGWDPYVILSPTAATWVDVALLAEVSGHPVRVDPRIPSDPDPLPPADTIVAAPLTFNSLNKWAAGISDTLAFGLLNEALGLGLRILAATCAKESLRRHPAFTASRSALRTAGVSFLGDEVTARKSNGSIESFEWAAVARMC